MSKTMLGIVLTMILVSMVSGGLLAAAHLKPELFGDHMDELFVVGWCLGSLFSGSASAILINNKTSKSK